MRPRSSSDEASNSSCTSVRVERQPRFERRHELLPALAGQRGHGDGSRIDRLQPRALASVEPVQLVEDLDRGDLVGVDFREHAAHGGHLELAVGVRRVDDVHQQVRGRNFLERGAKRRDERVRQAIDEADGVRHEELPPVRQPHLADKRIERDEERVRCHGVIARERVEERRLAGVGVADEGDRRDGALLAALAQLRAPAADHVDFLRQHADALPNAPAIGLELGLAGASGPDAAAKPRQGLTRPDEPRQEILQLRELDLQLPFPRARAAREDVEDELRAVHDLAAERLLEVA